jgi:hypothetical protein
MTATASIHGFRNESGEPASMLLHFAQGARREGYFEGLAEFAISGKPGDDELAEFYLRHDNTRLSPGRRLVRSASGPMSSDEFRLRPRSNEAKP